MKSNRIISTILIVLPLLFSCRREEPWNSENPRYYKAGEIVVRPYADEDWQPMEKTKALADLEAKDVDINRLKDPVNGGFGVYAYYTGADDFSGINDNSTIHGLVFNKRKFVWESDTWKNYQWNGSAYAAGKSEFWPAKTSENLTFFAFAPWATWYDKVQTSSTYDCPYIVYDSYVAEDLSPAELEAQEDVLWGTNTFGMTHKNVGMTDYTPEGVVDMHFRHAVAKVHFSVLGSLSGTSISTSGDPNGEYPAGPIVETQGAEKVTGPTEGEVIRVRYSGNGNNTRYTCYQYETTTYTIEERQEQDVTLSRNATVTVNGKVYLVDHVTFSGFKNSGTLLLDNASAYSPSWVLGNSTVNYTLSPSGTALKTSLQAVQEATLRNNISTYSGISETPTDMMGGYYLYVLPKESGTAPINVTLVYKTANVNGRESVDQVSGIVTKYHTRTLTRKFVRERVSKNHPRANESPTWGEWNDSGRAAQQSEVSGGNLGWYPSATTYTYSESDWNRIDWNYPDPDPSSWTNVAGTSSPIGNPTASYIETKTLTGQINTVFEGGNAYVIKLIVSGKELNLEVTPEPWELEDLPAYTFRNDENWPIQYLDYDSAYIDYEEGGNVYINNRMGKFSFQLNSGKYLSWQASLVGDPAFGFTDENGHFLMEGGEMVSSIRGPIDPNVMNYIYVRAINSSSTVTSRAKLRIYGIDSNGDATALLYLVNNPDVVEWTIVQNAN